MASASGDKNRDGRLDGVLNFDKLQQKVETAVESDKLYWLQNDAKFRAVNQRVGSYEEFSEIVKAAHLQPLDRSDKIELKRSGRWNPAAVAPDTSDGSSTLSTTSTNQQHPSEVAAAAAAEVLTLPLPISLPEFEKKYSSLSADSYKLQFLSNITSDPNNPFATIFKTEFHIDVFNDICILLSSTLKKNVARIEQLNSTAAARTATADVTAVSDPGDVRKDAMADPHNAEVDSTANDVVTDNTVAGTDVDDVMANNDTEAAMNAQINVNQFVSHESKSEVIPPVDSNAFSSSLMDAKDRCEKLSDMAVVILTTVSNAKRFRLMIDFLSKSDTEIIVELFDAMRCADELVIPDLPSGRDHSISIDELKNRFLLT